MRTRIIFLRAKEYITFDWRHLSLLIYFAMRVRNLFKRGDAHLPSHLVVLGTIWRSATLSNIRIRCEKDLKKLDLRFGEQKVAKAFETICVSKNSPELSRQLRDTVQLGKLPFKNRLIILKAPSAYEKGVLVMSFTHFFPYFMDLIDPSIFDSYHLVLEPSWVGAFTPDWLLFRKIPHKIWIQSCESRDNDFLRSIALNLIPIPDVTANCWTHPDLFKPLPGEDKVYDLAVVSGWADFKRHYILFEAMRKIGIQSFRVACAGMRMEHNLDHMKHLAEHYGVLDQVDFFEALPPAELNVILNRSKAHALFSRKEGYNRATIEAMFAGVPSFIREGMNYGMTYPYTNGISGDFYNEKKLPEFLKKIHGNGFASMNPRNWVMENMSPRISTERLERAIFGDMQNRLKIKVNAPEFAYFNPGDRTELEGAYADLQRFLKKNQA